jgi:hypothetical protein
MPHIQLVAVVVDFYKRRSGYFFEEQAVGVDEKRVAAR